MASVHQENVEFLKGHEDRYYKNDLIFALEVDSIEDLGIYDVILFVDDDYGLMCHRIVRIDVSEEKIWTRGDANNILDGVVDFHDVKGKVVGVIPQIGALTLYLHSPYGILGVSLAFFFLFWRAYSC